MCIRDRDGTVDVGTFNIHGGETVGRCKYKWSGQVTTIARITNNEVVGVALSGRLGESCLGSYKTYVLDYELDPKK